MNGSNIIAFFGRARTGKGVLSSVCEEFDYTPIAFANPLKTLISRLIHVSFEDIEILKYANNSYIFHEDDFKFISNETEIPIDIVRNILGDKEFKNTRELLQVIGTDLIRSYNEDWHVNKTRETIISNPRLKYVITDGRFPNEKKMVEDLNGTCWFVVRPTFKFVSHHISEEAVFWQEFNHIVINNKSVEHLKFLWRLMMENGYDTCMKGRAEILAKCFSDESFVEKLGNPTEKEEFNLLDALFISPYEFTYRKSFVDNLDIVKMEEKDGYVYVTTSDESHQVVIANPLEIEDLKKFV